MERPRPPASRGLLSLAWPQEDGFEAGPELFETRCVPVGFVSSARWGVAYEELAEGAEIRSNNIDWLAGRGEMAGLIRTLDWAQTPLGPVESWSPALRMIVGLLVANRVPLLLWWGPDYISIYNDAYRPVLGTKHPWALGKPFRECWPEIRLVLEPLIDAPFNGGPATWMEDILLEVNRNGFFEETHFNHRL